MNPGEALPRTRTLPVGRIRPEAEAGSIIWAAVPDRFGRNPKNRPLVVVMATDRIASGTLVEGVAVSSTFREPLPPVCVALPWDPRGRSSTGFRKACCAVCNWGMAVPFEDVEPTGEYVPTRVLNQILDRIAALRAAEQGQGQQDQQQP